MALKFKKSEIYENFKVANYHRASLVMDMTVVYLVFLKTRYMTDVFITRSHDMVTDMTIVSVFCNVWTQLSCFFFSKSMSLPDDSGHSCYSAFSVLGIL